VLAAAMTRHGVERASLVGNSMGCQTAVELAVTQPERVAALVLLGPTTDPAGATIPHMAARLVVDTFRETLVHNCVVGTDYLRRGPVKTYRQAQWMLRHRIEERLRLVPCPVLVVRGERDAIAPRRWVEQAAALAPRGASAEVPGAAHSAHYTHPDEVLRLARDYLTAT
jgi:pimeloyl-ACP methyl ester carboxylesterase